MPPMSGADLRVLDETGFQFGEIDVEHHHDEEEQHGHRADIDDDEQHREELGVEQDEKSSGVEECQDEEQHGVDGVLRQNDRRA